MFQGKDMSNDEKRIEALQYQRYVWIIFIVWTSVLVSSLLWNIQGINTNLLEDARLQALVAFDKDIHYRRWNAGHGGVYVNKGENAIPNPYLFELTDRDKITTDGDTLTLINPAYMTRQLHELELQESGVRGHITSLKPIRPENAADHWEQMALRRFESGSDEVTSLESMKTGEYFRFMRPLVTEEACLQCHRQQGYKKGDIRGGISISIPMEPLRVIADKDIFRISVVHVAIWFLGLLGVLFSAIRIRESTRKKQLADEQVKESEQRYMRLASELKESNDLHELLLDIITHDLRNPAGVIQSVSMMLNDEIPDNQKVELIKSSGIRLMEVMENAQTLAQASTGESIAKERRSVSQIIRDVCEEFSSQLDSAGMALRIDLENDLEAEVNLIISEVFVNYLSNVIKYAPETSQIVIDVQENGDSFTVRFRDLGETIPPEDREKVFQRGFQLSKGEKRGRGLGLAIVKRIAEAHGGKVWVEPNQPRGNSFCLRLPR
jgi:signal transduction histidine kinase